MNTSDNPGFKTATDFIGLKIVTIIDVRFQIPTIISIELKNITILEWLIFGEQNYLDDDISVIYMKQRIHVISFKPISKRPALNSFHELIMTLVSIDLIGAF